MASIEYGFRVPSTIGFDLDVWPNRNDIDTMTLDEIKTACKLNGYVLIGKDRPVVRVISIRD